MFEDFQPENARGLVLRLSGLGTRGGVITSWNGSTASAVSDDDGGGWEGNYDRLREAN